MHYGHGPNALRWLLYFCVHLSEFIDRAVLCCAHVRCGIVLFGAHFHECVYFLGRNMEKEHVRGPLPTSAMCEFMQRLIEGRVSPFAVGQQQIVCVVGVFWPNCLFDRRAFQNMVYRLGVYMSCFVFAACSHATALGEPGQFYGNAVARPDYILNLQPPEENTHDVEASLDSIMKVEDEKRILSDTDFAAAKERLVNVAKQRIHDIVREAFPSPTVSA